MRWNELTPSTATPENLAKLGRLIGMGQPLARKAVDEAIGLCVQAWEHDRLAGHEWRIECESLRKRLPHAGQAGRPGPLPRGGE